MSRAMKTSKIPFAPQIPETWREIPNRFLFLEHSSKVGEQWKEYQLLSLTTSGVKEKNINDTGGKVPDSYDNYQTVEKGDMVFCLFDLDCSAVFSGLSSYNGMITSAYDVFRTNEKYLDNTYARFWFDYVFSRRYYKMFSKNIRYTITTDVFKSIYTPCPPIAEQKRIGAFLDNKCGEIDEMISLQEKIVEELKAYKQSVITEAVCRGLNPNVQMKDSGIEWVDSIPSHWAEVRFYKVNYIRGRLGWKGLKAEEYTETGYPFLSAFNLISDKVSWKELNFISQERYDESPEIKLSVGDILVVKDGAGIGKCARIDSLPMGEATVNSSLAVITPNNRMLYTFQYYYMLSTPFQHIIWLLKIGMGVPHLTQENMHDILETCPPIEEQEQISNYLDEKCNEIDALISVKQSKIDALKEYKKSIIYEYITGKKEVNG